MVTGSLMGSVCSTGLLRGWGRRRGGGGCSGCDGCGEPF